MKSKGVIYVVDIVTSQLAQQAVRNKLNVLYHQAIVHANQIDGQGFSDEDALNVKGFCDDLLDAILWNLVDQVLVVQVKQQNSQWLPSSRDINSLEKVKTPASSPRFFIQ